MKDLLRKFNFDKEEIDEIMVKLSNFNYYKIEKVVELFSRYNCDLVFVREIFINRIDILSMDLEKLEFTIEAILANGDIIEETLLQLV